MSDKPQTSKGGARRPYFLTRYCHCRKWKKRGVRQGKEFAILTDEITRSWPGMTTRQYKDIKRLKKENLRDNMSDTELVLTMLAEASTRDISRAEKPEGFTESKRVAKRGGSVARVAR